MSTPRCQSAVLLLACFSAGCRSHDERAADAGPPARLTVATYNAGLLPSVGYVQERLPFVEDALGKLEAQVLCVQEVWEDAHWQAVVKANEHARPHVLRIADDPGVVGKCSADVFNPLEACAASSCANAPALIPCVATSCAAEVAELDSACLQCLLDNANSGDLGVIRTACVGMSTSSNEGPLPPEQRSYVSGGSFGIGLLSALPFAESEEKKLDSSTVRRGILYARVDDSALGPVHLFCTHLGAILKGVKYEGSYGGWEGENAHHTDDLIAFVNEKVKQGEQVIVLGDMNNGPAGKDIVASEPASYAKFAAAGLADPYLAGANASCTFCTDNPLVNPNDEGAQAAIDHILTRGIPGGVVERIFDDLIEIQVETDTSDASMPAQDAGSAPAQKASSSQTVGLSDHYGLRGTFEK